jgi:hypothetical protein
LTLVVVPVVYTYLDGLGPATLRAWFAVRRRRRDDAVAPLPGVPTPAVD